ncbi:MAG: hypothetical protein WA162_08545 [Thermodesulfobacteriota bacterium]
MSQNFAAIKSITDNVQSVLQGQGIKFSRSTFEDEKNIPTSLLPLGEIYYIGEDFQYTRGQRAGYAEANFLVKVVLQDRDSAGMIRSTQKWVHSMRDALIVNAFNIGDLAVSKLVSLVTVERVDIENKGDVAVLGFKVKIRYRET